MAKFNLSRFNLAKYNRHADGAVVFDKIKIDAIFIGQFGLGQKTIDALRLNAVISAQIAGAAGTIDQEQLDAVIASEIVSRYIAFGHDTMAAVFDQEEAHSAAIVMDNITAAAEISQETCLSPNVRDLGIRMTAEISCEPHLGNVVMDPNPIQAYGIFGAVVTAEAFEEIILNLDITLKPGDILVIDSDNFRVLRNGKNAIKYHSGDWIDELNRNSKSITIDGGGTALESSIYFQELWL